MLHTEKGMLHTEQYINKKNCSPLKKQKRDRPHRICKERIVVNIECGNNFLFHFFFETPSIGPCPIPRHGRDDLMAFSRETKRFNGIFQDQDAGVVIRKKGDSIERPTIPQCATTLIRNSESVFCYGRVLW